MLCTVAFPHSNFLVGHVIPCLKAAGDWQLAIVETLGVTSPSSDLAT